jgi:septal ring factor EnvC (AmiA/AmiB activator)
MLFPEGIFNTSSASPLALTDRNIGIVSQRLSPKIFHCSLGCRFGASPGLRGDFQRAALAPISYEIAPISYEIAQISDEIAQISDEIAQISDEIAQISDEIAQISYEIAPISDEIAQISDEIAAKATLGAASKETDKTCETGAGARQQGLEQGLDAVFSVIVIMEKPRLAEIISV